MFDCHFDPGFYNDFKYSLESLGLPVPPPTLFGTLKITTANIAILTVAIQRFGPTATMGEVLLTIPAFAASGAILELIAVIGATMAAFYIGALVGALGYATYKTLNCNSVGSMDFMKAWRLVEPVKPIPAYMYA